MYTGGWQGSEMVPASSIIPREVSKDPCPLPSLALRFVNKFPFHVLQAVFHTAASMQCLGGGSLLCCLLKGGNSALPALPGTFWFLKFHVLRVTDFKNWENSARLVSFSLCRLSHVSLTLPFPRPQSPSLSRQSYGLFSPCLCPSYILFVVTSSLHLAGLLVFRSFFCFVLFLF